MPMGYIVQDPRESVGDAYLLDLEEKGVVVNFSSAYVFWGGHHPYKHTEFYLFNFIILPRTHSSVQGSLPHSSPVR